MKKEEKKKWEKKLKPCEEEDHNSDETIIIGSNESHDFLWEWTIDIPWYEMRGEKEEPLVTSVANPTSTLD